MKKSKNKSSATITVRDTGSEINWDISVSCCDGDCRQASIIPLLHQLLKAAQDFGNELYPDDPGAEGRR